MNKWKKFYENNDGNHFPHTALVSFFYKNFINIKKNFSILDLGCGAGSTLKLTDKKNFSFDLVDISEKVLKKINRNNKNKNFCTFNKSFIEFLQSSKKKYELIIDIGSLQHQSKQNFMKSFHLLKKNLKKNGIFFSINLHSSKKINNNNFLVTRNNKKDLIKYVKSSGLKMIDYQSHIYTENYEKKFIKYNIIIVKNLN